LPKLPAIVGKYDCDVALWWMVGRVPLLTLTRNSVPWTFSTVRLPAICHTPLQENVILGLVDKLHLTLSRWPQVTGRGDRCHVLWTPAPAKATQAPAAKLIENLHPDSCLRSKDLKTRKTSEPSIVLALI